MVCGAHRDGLLPQQVRLHQLVLGQGCRRRVGAGLVVASVLRRHHPALLLLALPIRLWRRPHRRHVHGLPLRVHGGCSLWASQPPHCVHQHMPLLVSGSNIDRHCTSQAVGTPPMLAAIALGQLSNVMGCLSTYGIGSAPPYYGAGYVPQSKWYQLGFLLSIFYISVWLFAGGAWWKVRSLILWTTAYHSRDAAHAVCASLTTFRCGAGDRVVVMPELQAATHSHEAVRGQVLKTFTCNSQSLPSVPRPVSLASPLCDYSSARVSKFALAAQGFSVPYRVSRRNQLQVRYSWSSARRVISVAARCDSARLFDAVVRNPLRRCHHGSALCWTGSGGEAPLPHPPRDPSPLQPSCRAAAARTQHLQHDAFDGIICGAILSALLSQPVLQAGKGAGADRPPKRWQNIACERHCDGVFPRGYDPDGGLQHAKGDKGRGHN